MHFDTSSPADGVVFWSGSKEGAARYADSIGGTILEQTPGGQVFDNWRGLEGMYPKWNSKDSLDQRPIWQALSSQYAEGAAGKVTYVLKEGYNNPESMWMKTENPILVKLKRKGIVTEIFTKIIKE